MKKRFLITAALPYANGPLHIGHLAGSYLPADIFVRYLRKNQKEVAFICGSDEHGAAITLRAKKEGISPKQIIDKYHYQMKETFEKLGISFDIYHRTSSELHHQTAQEMFLKMYEQGCFVEKSSEQYFDESFQQFLADRYIVGTCPKCENPKAYGDQCEKCGSSLSPSDLINPISVLSNTKPVLKTTKHWYLPMGDHAAWVREYIEKGILEGQYHHDPKTWKAHVLGQCITWLNDGLHDRAMTRDLDWGVKMPLKDTEGKVLYVWFDAPIGYISATKAWAESQGKRWEDFWQDEDCELVHFIGKDNIVFHCIIFPIILKAHGNFILPSQVPANEFMNLEGDKISTSREWAVWAHEFLQDFPGKADVLRYVLCALMPETKDSEFTWKEFTEKYHNELIANLGNFVNRALVLTHKHSGGKVPELGIWDAQEQSYIDILAKIPQGVSTLLEQYKFKEALAEVLQLSRLGNKLFAETEPWKLAQTDPQKMARVLHLGLQICANLSILIEPFLPFTSEKLRLQLNMPIYTWDKAGRIDLLAVQHSLQNPEPLFEKIPQEQIDLQIEKLQAKKAQPTIALGEKNQEIPENNIGYTKKYPPLKEFCTFEDFAKLDLRSGKIVQAERVPKADKLLKLQVDLGFETRTIVSGIANFFEPEKLVGQSVIVVANLAPRAFRGIESQGMLLLGEDENGKLIFAQTSVEFGTGWQIR